MTPPFTPIEMKRKLVQQGAATLMVSLPRRWIKQFNLKKGEEIEIQEQENTLLLSGKEVKVRKETELTLANKTEAFIRFLIISLYRAGYEKVTLRFEQEEQFRIINQTIKNYLIGFDVVEKKKGYCVIENMTEPSPDQFEIILQKILYNIKTMIGTTVERLEAKKPVMDYKEVLQNIHQYDNFCRRTLTKQHNERAVYYWNFLSVIIHNSRDLYNLNKFLDNKKSTKASRETINLLKNSTELIEEIIKAYQKKDIKELGEVDEKKKTLISRGFELLKKTRGNETEITHYIITSIRNLHRATSPLLGLLL